MEKTNPLMDFARRLFASAYPLELASTTAPVRPGYPAVRGAAIGFAPGVPGDIGRAS